MWKDSVVPFQFQTGAIKSAIVVDDAIRISKTFQFQTGAIKSFAWMPKQFTADSVSIPNWCD